MSENNSIRITRDLLIRIFSKIKISTTNFYKGVPCWEWLGCLNSRGFSRLTMHRKEYAIHKLLYHLFVEPIRNHTQSIHLCRMPHCVNPIHLQLETKEIVAGDRLPINNLILENIFSKIEISTEKFFNNVPCWEWTAGIGTNGYGNIRYPFNKCRTAHRIIYQIFVERIPDSLECDHLCRNRKCVNPCHIEPVTHKENMMRGESIQALNARKTHCKYGHPFADGNLLNSKRRICRTCHSTRTRENAYKSARLAGVKERKAITHCPQGHFYSPENTIYTNKRQQTGKSCRTCRNESKRHKWAELKAKLGHSV